MAARLALVHGQSCCRSLVNFLVRIGERTLNEDLQSMMDLASRAVACDGWPGMLLFDGKSAFTVPISWRHGTEGQRAAPILGSPMFKNALPDLTDPATLGCLLALVREAWDDPQVHAAPLCGMKNDHVGWRVWLGRDLTLYFDGDTEFLIYLVAALEAAP